MADVKKEEVTRDNLSDLVIKSAMIE